MERLPGSEECFYPFFCFVFGFMNILTPPTPIRTDLKTLTRRFNIYDSFPVLINIFIMAYIKSTYKEQERYNPISYDRYFQICWEKRHSRKPFLEKVASKTTDVGCSPVCSDIFVFCRRPLSPVSAHPLIHPHQSHLFKGHI